MAFIDHINLRIPDDRVDEALKFYRDLLGLDTWKLEEYREGERTSFFFRIGENAVLNMRPKESFERPSGKNFDHFCIVKDVDIDIVRKKVKEEGFKVLREGTPLGTQGRAPAIYVEDPFGYVIELKKEKTD